MSRPMKRCIMHKCDREGSRAVAAAATVAIATDNSGALMVSHRQVFNDLSVLALGAINKCATDRY